MLTFFIVVILIVSVLLVLVILAQNSKGGGLTAGMSGASQAMGARRTTDWIEKATWSLGIGLFVLCMMATIFVGPVTESIGSPNVERAKEEGGFSAPALDLNTEEEAPAATTEDSGLIEPTENEEPNTDTEE